MSSTLKSLSENCAGCCGEGFWRLVPDHRPNRHRALLAGILNTMALALTFLLTGCSDKPPGDAHASSGVRAPEFTTNVTAYEVNGVLKEFRAQGWKLLIAHEDIPGYMEAMTMLLDVKSTNDLGRLQPGDAIHFRMLVTDSDGWIDRVTKVGSGVPSPNPAAPAPSQASVQELEAGALLPDCVLTNQLGKEIRLSDYKGHALAFTFIFTRCPFPVYCPRMNNNFSAVQHELSKNGTGTNWQLLSISFDPDHDTPSRMATYAKSYHYDPTHWSFATGASEDIRRLGSSFGLAFWREGSLFNHNVRTVVVDAQGRVQHIFAGNEWKPGELVGEMTKAMTPVSSDRPLQR